MYYIDFTKLNKQSKYKCIVKQLKLIQYNEMHIHYVWNERKIIRWEHFFLNYRKMKCELWFHWLL